MILWLQQNWGSILVIGVIVAIVAAVIISRIRAKKQGKSTCGCGCSQCSMNGLCHENQNAKEQGKK